MSESKIPFIDVPPRQLRPLWPLRPILRKQLTPLQRNQLAASQEWKCKMCEKPLPASFDVDHIDPLWETRDNNSMDNFQALCCDCHRKKTIQDLQRRIRLKREQQKQQQAKSILLQATVCKDKPIASSEVITRQSPLFFESFKYKPRPQPTTDA